MSQSPLNPYSIRRFLPEDMELYKAIRLEALQLEAGMFGSNYAREASFTDQQWIERINGHNSDCFGLFYGDQHCGFKYVTREPCDRPDESLFRTQRLHGVR
jgi:hypothetical protein